MDYLTSNVAGGEGYDWYYHSSAAREAQVRTPITDGTHNEPWVFRYKDIKGWWESSHHDRMDGMRDESPTGWVPASKPIVFCEMGCAAIYKGTNQPNKFLDEKSSESSLPWYSNGRRDEFVQQQYLRAMTGYWTDPANNPVSGEYGAPMVDMSRAHVWAWDARPYPTFPNNRALWSDGGNYARGHWITGRTATRPLASVVREVCERAGVAAFDVSDLRGVVRGYVVDEVVDARTSLQPLMLQHGFDAVERDGILFFLMRDGGDAVVIDPAYLAVSDDIEGDIEKARQNEAEFAGRVRVQFVEADGNFDVLAEEAVLPDEATHAVSSSQLPLSLTRAEGHQVAERWLNEARVSREGVRFALPPSALSIGAGDVVSLPGESGEGLYRVDRVEQGSLQIAEAVRIEPAVYTSADYVEETPTQRAFVPPVPVLPLFMDLPLITGDEDPIAPHLAVTASPWPGSVAVYDSGSDSNYALNLLATHRATIGVTETPLLRAPAGRFDRGEGLQVKLISGAFEGIGDDRLLNGGNLAMIGDGSAGRWELFQFRDADLIAPETWWLSHRLRGQLGSDGLMPDVWPAGSYVVLFDADIDQTKLTSNMRNIARHYRIGPAQRGYDDPAYEHLVEAFAGNGLRPYRPCHLRAVTNGSGGMDVQWVRRTRVDGDNWELADVPLGEESEQYHLRVKHAGSVKREATVGASEWTYGPSDQAADGVTAPYVIEVAQVSARYGPGLYASLTVQA